MLSLLIETSTERGLVAILDDLNLINCIDLPIGINNSKLLLPIIEKILKETNVNLKQFSLIISGIGPGSYTGIRVGAMVAKTISYAAKIPLVGVCSLEGFVPKENGKFAALIDAKIGGAYVLVASKSADGITILNGPMLSEMTGLAEKLENVTTIVTPHAGSLREKVLEIIPKATFAWEDVSPNPQQMAHTAIQKLARGEASLDGHLDLLYLRKTQAEIEREKK